MDGNLTQGIYIMRTILLTTVLLAFWLALPGDIVGAGENENNDERPTIALVNRVVEIVERRSPEIDWQTAKIGDLLNSGDIVKTGAGSFSLIRFYDNSLLRVRELSEVTVYADRDRDNYHRDIEVDEGSVSFDVRKKEADRFEFSTPTSVASIRGSTGILIVRPGQADVLLMVTGLAMFLNRITGEEIEVYGGEIAFSFSDGNLEKRELTDDDLEEYGEPGDELDDTPGERQQRTIEIRTMDEDGNPRTLIIEYEEDKTDQ